MTAQTSAPAPRSNPDDQMLTLQEACAFLRTQEGTLRYWRHLGTGPRSFKVGRHVRYWRTDLVLWLTEQTEQDSRLGSSTRPQGELAPPTERRTREAR